jgi:hypothetical protein
MKVYLEAEDVNDFRHDSDVFIMVEVMGSRQLYRRKSCSMANGNYASHRMFKIESSNFLIMK